MNSPNQTLKRLRDAVALASFLVATPVLTAVADDDGAAAKLTEAAVEHRTRLDYDGDTFSGPALDQLLAAARAMRLTTRW